MVDVEDQKAVTVPDPAGSQDRETRQNVIGELCLI